MNRFRIRTLVAIAVLLWVFGLASPFLLSPFLERGFMVCTLVSVLPAMFFLVLVMNRISFLKQFEDSFGIEPPVTLRERDVMDWWRREHGVFEKKTSEMEDEIKAMLDELKEVLSAGNYFGRRRHEITRLCREIYWKENSRLGLYTQIRALPGLKTVMLD